MGRLVIVTVTGQNPLVSVVEVKSKSCAFTHYIPVNICIKIHILWYFVDNYQATSLKFLWKLPPNYQQLSTKCVKNTFHNYINNTSNYRLF